MVYIDSFSVDISKYCSTQRYICGHMDSLSILNNQIVSVFLITMYYLFVSFFTYQSLNGSLSGKILFENSSLVIQGEVFDLQDINELDLALGDYYGKKPLRLYKSVNPMLSQGVGNYITFTDKTGQTHVVYFKLENQNSCLSLTAFVNKAVKLNKMSVHDAIELLGIENVSIN